MNDKIFIRATGDDGEPIEYPFKLMFIRKQSFDDCRKVLWG